jgi:hypothetical protein
MDNFDPMKFDWSRYRSSAGMSSEVFEEFCRQGKPALGPPKTEPKPQVKSDDWNQWFQKNFDWNIGPYLEIIGEETAHALADLIGRIKTKAECEHVVALEHIITLQSRAIDLLRDEIRKSELNAHERLEAVKTECRRMADDMAHLGFDFKLLQHNGGKKR